jgi:hypothetical protein
MPEQQGELVKCSVNAEKDSFRGRRVVITVN